MSVIAKFPEIERLGFEGRVALAEELWESAREDEAAAPFDEAFLAELERRVADSKAHPEKLVPWETIKAEALARIRA